MTSKELQEMLEAAGFFNGWAMNGDKLVLWEHEEDPPAPLIRPA